MHVQPPTICPLLSLDNVCIFGRVRFGGSDACYSLSLSITEPSFASDNKKKKK